MAALNALKLSPNEKPLLKFVPATNGVMGYISTQRFKIANDGYIEPDHKEVWAKRERLRRKLINDPLLLKAYKVFYKTHPVEFINDWLCTYNPEVFPSTLPMKLFQKQEELIHFITNLFETRTEGIGEKARAVGFTDVVCCWAIWAFIFIPEVKIGFGSRKQGLVDLKGNNDSIFEKLRVKLDKIPQIFRPKGYNREKHSPLLRILNPETGASITGEAGKNIGRGGRNSIYFIDEAAYLDKPEIVDGALSENAQAKFWFSTPNGVGNTFYQKRNGGKYPVFTCFWYDDPRKTWAWYLAKKDRTDSVIFAKEIDLSYEDSNDGTVIPYAWIKAAVNLPLTLEGMKVAGFDPADEGPDGKGWAIRHGRVLTKIIEWKDGNISTATRRAYNDALYQDVEEINYDVIGIGVGAKVDFDTLSKASKLEGKVIKINPINVGDQALVGTFMTRKCKDQFSNLKAELWWRLRRSFEQTYEFVNGIKEHPLDELISIPNDIDLITQLSMPKFDFSSTGKIRIEEKKAMKKRLSVKSPNKADAVILAFAPKPQQLNVRMV